MRRGVLIAAAILACGPSCGAFSEGRGEATPDGGSSTADAGGADSANTADGAVGSCSEEERTTSKHCGRCGRDCGGGQCVSGDCLPYPIATAGSAWYLTVDATNVYWTSRASVPGGYAAGSGELFRMNKLGGAPQSLAAADGIFDVAVLGTSIFYTSFGGGGAEGVYRISSAGPGAEPSIAGTALELVVQADKIYAITSDVETVLKVMTETSSATPVKVLGLEADATEGLASDGTFIYWANHTPDGSIVRLKLADNSTSAIVTNTVSPRRVTVDDEFVYWTSDIDLAIRRVAKEGGAVLRLIGIVDVGFGRVIADPEHLYATIDREGRVVRTDKDGNNVRNIATGLTHPMGLAQDATAIYFSECSSTGKIWRMVK